MSCSQKYSFASTITFIKFWGWNRSTL